MNKYYKYFYYILPIIIILLIIPFMLGGAGLISPKTVLQIIFGTFGGHIGTNDILALIGIGILPFASLISLFVPFFFKNEIWKKRVMIFFTIINIITLIIILLSYLLLSMMRPF